MGSMISLIFLSLSLSKHFRKCNNFKMCDMSHCSNQVLNISSCTCKNLLELLTMIIVMSKLKLYKFRVMLPKAKGRLLIVFEISALRLHIAGKKNVCFQNTSWVSPCFEVFASLLYHEYDELQQDMLHILLSSLNAVGLLNLQRLSSSNHIC